MKKKVSKKIYWYIGLAIAVTAVVLFFIFNGINAKKMAAASFQTVKLERGDLTAIVGATGTVHARQSAELTWQSSGRIEKINVSIGERVNADTVLASLLESSLPQSIILAKADLVTAERNLENLINSNLGKAQAQLNLVNAKQAYDDAEWYALEEGTLRSTNSNKLDSTKAALVLAQDRVNKAQDVYDRYASKPDDNLAKANALSALAAAKENLRIAENNLSFYINPPQTKDVDLTQAKLALALAQYEDAQREWERQKDGPNPQDIAADEARIAAIKATISTAEISAPFTGTVTDISGMVGDLVSAGSLGFRIDDLSQLLVDVQIPEVDINRIKAGQNVDLTFDAITAAQYQGRVKEVARVGTETGGMVNFNVTVEILNPDEQVLPGMTAAVNIVVSKLSDVLTLPNRAVRLVDDKKIVYVLRNSVPTAVEIEIGASSDTVSEIISGNLKEGELIILNPPTDFANFSGAGGPPF